MRRTSVQLIVAVTLLALLGVLGTLQYRWLGEVSAAEGERLRNSLRARAVAFARDFDREITHAYMAFRADPDLVGADAAAALSDAYARAQADSIVGGIVESVYYFEATGPRAAQLLQLDPAARSLAAVDWPPEFEPWRRRADLVASAPGLPPLFIGDAVDARTPALVVALPTMKRFVSGDRVAIVHDTDGATRTVILRLNADKVRRQLIAALLDRHFGRADDSEYFAAVVSRDAAPQVIYASDRSAELSAANADVATGLFDLRLDELSRFTLPGPAPQSAADAPRPQPQDRMAITIVRRANGADAARVLMAGGDAPGAWQVLIRGKIGSLESVVARSRHRNAAIGLGVLGLLAASFMFLIGSARRQQRLAQQQMEFVAAVSHELRTPLAVIRSAGENLADGVVGDGDAVRKYGSLIRSEGRRLSDMVERVLEFAGISSGAPIRARAEVDLRSVVDEAVNGLQADARDRGVTLAVRASRELPRLIGDPAALQSAVQNVVGNAVKYSPSGGTVDVAVDGDRDRLRVTIADRGLGIDTADLPHIFKPFYRGRRAVDAQIRGTGVGLSVVRHVVEAHGGEVRVVSRVGEGTTVVITLPAAADGEGFARDAQQAGAGS